jgi:hypothetical protein
MKRALQVLSSLAFVALSSHASAASSDAQIEKYVEPGRWGVQWTVTEDTVFVGLAYDSDKYDFLFNISGHTYIGSGGPTQSYPINTHFGLRENLGSQNYFAYGLAANVVAFGTDYGSGVGSSFTAPAPAGAQGVDIAGAGRVGPYIALQRHFAHSGLMLNVWTMPYAYQTNIVNANNQKVVTNDHRFFESGGIGIAYLFGDSGDDKK